MNKLTSQLNIATRDRWAFLLACEEPVHKSPSFFVSSIKDYDKRP